MTTNEGDYILDLFLGSGSTAAVAYKMNRKWIGIGGALLYSLSTKTSKSSRRRAEWNF
ncbi:DNA methyltransferase [Clostridium sporogenes]|uniref:DNA methyltransferase n=1 Tax=Clostridium sporogenes TaxID=1509 RepID=UPI001FABCB57|nr:DNA methyltransferase [Clostridium sporogenes]